MLHRARLILQRLHRLPAGDLPAGDRDLLQRANHTLSVTIPNNYYQIDFVCGAAIGQLEPNQNNDAYGPDSANILYHAESRYISSDNGGCTAPNPMPTGTPATPPTPTTSTASSATLTDSATLSGGYNPSGTITFYLFAPGVTPNGTDSNNVYSDTVTISGNGTYTTAAGTHPGGYVPTAAGTYQWVAVYSGDANNNGVAGPFGSEPESVSPRQPGHEHHARRDVTLGGMVKLTDSATLSGGYNPAGTITFYLFAPGVTPNGSDSNNVYSDTVTVTGDGTYSTSTGNNPGGYSPTSTGTYQWVAVYSGDASNAGVAGTFGNEPETVNSRLHGLAGAVRHDRLLAEPERPGHDRQLQRRFERHAARQLAGEQLPEPVRPLEPVHQQHPFQLRCDEPGRADQRAGRRQSTRTSGIRAA